VSATLQATHALKKLA
jgi:hypothetical protein